MNFEEYFSRLTDMLERIGDNLPRCRIYEELFPKHKPLQDSIAQMYTAVVGFLRYAETVFKSSRRVLGESMWKKFDEKFHDELAKLRQHGEAVEIEAGVANKLEEKKARDELSEVSRKLSQTNVELSCIRAKLYELSTIQSREQGKPISRVTMGGSSVNRHTSIRPGRDPEVAQRKGMPRGTGQHSSSAAQLRVGPGAARARRLALSGPRPGFMGPRSTWLRKVLSLLQAAGIRRARHGDGSNLLLFL